ncbi:hypothetical protein NMG60_11025774 [Bertholletia excelsa]
MERAVEKLIEAAHAGNTELLLELHRHHPLLLDRIIVAALLGHCEFAKVVVGLKPELAKALDSSGSSPLHLASAKGYIQIVHDLVLSKPEMCSVLNRDGLNPLHLVAIKGNLEVLKELARTRPEAARASSAQGETITHLCVKYFQMEALKLLLGTESTALACMGVQDLINARDEYGNTILHIAVADKQIETVRHLLKTGKVDDILAQSRRDVLDWDIGNSLQEAGDLKGCAVTGLPSVISSNFPTHTTAHCQARTSSFDDKNPQMPSFLWAEKNSKAKQGDNESHGQLNQGKWLAKKTDALMAMASLMATMAFQAGVNPPGGVWQENIPGQYNAGEAVVAFKYPGIYKYYLSANAIGFFSSLSAILFLISGLPLKRKIFMWGLMMIMWLAITFMAYCYTFSIIAVTPKKSRVPLRHTMNVAVPVWCGVMALLLLRHNLPLSKNWSKRNIDIRKQTYLRALMQRFI